jgi:hypothetical protein
MGEFEFEDSEVSDALTYADQTVGPHGRPMTMEYRIRGGDHPPRPRLPKRASASRARVERVPYLLAVANRVEGRLTIDAVPASTDIPTGTPSPA